MEDFEEFQDYDEVYFNGKPPVICLCRLTFYVSLLCTLILLLNPMCRVP
jgi:hypothetical protein